MAKLTLADLKKMREEQKASFNIRESGEKTTTVLIGMGTCGIASGAKEALSTFVEELTKAGLKDVAVKQTGCMGLCNVEPTVEIRMEGMPDTIYGNVTADRVQEIVQSHMVDKKLVDNLIQDKPAGDILA